MIYLTVFLLNIFSLALYYRIALRFHIIDQPNERSSHNYITVRGAGVIFLMTGLIWTFLNLNEHIYFVAGLLSIGLISFLDDVITLSNKPRFIVQVIAVLLAMMNLDMLLYLDVLTIVFVLVLYIGWLNAFNFMDGINGISSFYALSILLPLYYVLHEYSLPYLSLIKFICISIMVFMTLNVRSRALAFCGDVGAVVLAYIVGYLVIVTSELTGKVEFILFGSVYGVDVILTIIRRLIKGQNIFQPHRTHLYQLLSNELNWHYIGVSLIYSIIQIVISSLVIILIHTIPQYSFVAAILVLFLLVIAYLYSLHIVKLKL